MVRHFFNKRIVQLSLLIISCFGLVFLVGILLPNDIYRQKAETTEDVLITNCHIVDAINDTILYNQQILIERNTIIQIGEKIKNHSKKVTVFNANGQYIIPTLWDMHVHTISLSPQLHFPLLVANGVTNLRDMGDGDSWISDIDDETERDKSIWEKQALTQNLLLPNIREATSYHIEELDNISENNYKATIAELVTKLKKRGEPFIKVQLDDSGNKSNFFYQLQEEASKQGMPILGHLPGYVSIDKVLNNGYLSIEHAWALIPHFVKNRKNFKKDIEQKKYDLSNQDSLLGNYILKLMASKNTYYVPTHITSNKKEFETFNDNFNSSANNIYVENVQLLLWKALNWLHRKGYNKVTDLPVLGSYYNRGLTITNEAYKSGVKILAGSDALDRNVYYGISLHDELQEMVKAGLTNSEALKTATINAAGYYNLADKYGSIEEGKVADFIMLKKNPLEYIGNTKSITLVRYNNRMYDTNDLVSMKSFVQKQSKSFGISCKFIWNMIKRN